MNCMRIGACGIQRFGDFIGAMFGFRENQPAGKIVLRHHVEQRFRFVRTLHKYDALIDFQRLGGGNLDLHGVADKAVRQFRNRRRHSRRKKNALTTARHRRCQRPDRRHKTEVEHLIDFIQNKHFHLIEIDGVLPHQVEQPARRRYENIKSVSRSSLLFAHRSAANNEGRAQTHVLAIGVKAIQHLSSEFASRREHNHAAVAAARLMLRCGEFVQNRQRESRRFAGSCLGDANKVAPFHHWRNCALLNRRWCCVALFDERLRDRPCEAEVVEFCQNNLSMRRHV